ncbi:MAG: cob(I)yrinic acid a,c-diamide adenosyltransferase [Bacillota bacterium]
MSNSGLKQGLIQVYTGNGKGKSTAAFGLAVRAAGHGLRVQIIQFMKTGDYGENKALSRLSPEIEVHSFGRKGFISRGGAKPEDTDLAHQALTMAIRLMEQGAVDLLILDEINNALYFDLLTTEEVIQLLQSKPPQVELVLTGRNAPEAIIQEAHLVTEMCEIKHPYQLGIASREGIEF